MNDRLFSMAKTRVFFKTLSPAKLVKHVLSELIISAANSLLKVVGLSNAILYYI